MIVSSFPATNAGLKNGNPWMWSQCGWLIARIGVHRSPRRHQRIPQPRDPGPGIEDHEVIVREPDLDAWRITAETDRLRPGEGMDPACTPEFQFHGRP